MGKAGKQVPELKEITVKVGDVVVNKNHKTLWTVESYDSYTVVLRWNESRNGNGTGTITWKLFHEAYYHGDMINILHKDEL